MESVEIRNPKQEAEAQALAIRDLWDKLQARAKGEYAQHLKEVARGEEGVGAELRFDALNLHMCRVAWAAKVLGMRI